MVIVSLVINLILLVLLVLFMIDGLTFLWVRRIYQIMYSLVIKTKPHHVIMIDIDYFKSINDIYGHRTGDKVLRKVGLIILKESRGRAFRYGGEEFVILLPWTGKFKSWAIAQQILSRVKKEIAPVTASIGIGRFEEEADKALYKAKQAGRNCVRSWWLE